MSEKTFNVKFSRVEFVWLYRQLCFGRDKSKVLTEKESTPENLLQLEEMSKLVFSMETSLEKGKNERLALLNAKEELEEALILSPSSSVEIRKHLEELPKEESYGIIFDRNNLLFTLKLLEHDVTKFRDHIIPNYEKSSEDAYTDKIQTKEYFVNKAKKSKLILDSLRSKLEKQL